MAAGKYGSRNSRELTFRTADKQRTNWGSGETWIPPAHPHSDPLPPSRRLWNPPKQHHQ